MVRFWEQEIPKEKFYAAKGPIKNFYVSAKNIVILKLVTSSILRYVPDHCKTQKICDKAILEKSGTLDSFPDCYENKEMCNIGADN